MKSARLLIALAFFSVAKAKDHPNIVFILADDMGIDAVSALNPKIGDLKTPHIDRLISQGMNFTDAHSASAVCTPTRYGLLTGRYCWRTKLKSSVLWEYAPPLIEDERLTVVEMLRDQGYRTAMVGKWHLGFDWRDADGKIVNDTLKLSDAGFRPKSVDRLQAVAEKIDFSQPLTGGPTDHGFSDYWGVDVPNFPPYIWIKNDRIQGTPSAPKPEEMFGLPGPMLPGWKLEDILPTLARKAVAWIEQESENTDPFFLYLPLTSPHLPIAPSQKFQGFTGITPFADFVAETDWVLGQVMEALETSGAADDTLVIFTTDNGTSPRAGFAELEKHGVNLRATLRGHKGQIHEGGHRVPFVVRWPGKVEAGSVCRETICLNDFMATAAALTGCDLPAHAAEDSHNFLPLLTGPAKNHPKRPPLINHSYGGDFAIREGRWKFIPPNRLFDLESDLRETTNLAEEHPEVVQKLATKLAAIQKKGSAR